MITIEKSFPGTVTYPLKRLGDPKKLVFFDIETTGFSAENDRIIEIGAVRVEKGQITDKFSVFVNPQTPIPFEIEKLTGIGGKISEIRN